MSDGLDVVFHSRDCFRADGTHKRQYDRKEAKRKARQMGGNMQAYNCEHCPFWHVGNKVRYE